MARVVSFTRASAAVLDLLTTPAGKKWVLAIDKDAVTLRIFDGVTLGGVKLGRLAATLTQGSVVFAGASGVLAQDNANFFWDDTNNRLGILTASPQTRLQVGGAVGASGNVGSAGHFVQAADGIGLIVARSSANPYELHLGVNQATGWAEIQAAQGGVSFNKPLLLNRQAGNVAIGGSITSPQALLHVGASSATLRVYNSFTDASNGEWAEYSWASNVLNIGTNKNGTGATRNLQVNIGGTNRLDFGITNASAWTAAAALLANAVTGQSNTATTGLLDSGGNFALKNTDTTVNNWTRIQFLDSGGDTLGMIGVQNINHTNNEGGMAFGVRGDGQASALARLDYNISATNTWTTAHPFVASALTTTGVTSSLGLGTDSAGKLVSIATRVRATANLGKTSDTTLAAVTGLSASLVAGGTYIIRGTLFTSSTINGGVKMTLATSDTLTITSFQWGAGLFTSANGGTSAIASALGTAIGSTTAVAVVIFSGTIVVNAAGTLVVRAAQNASHADTTTILANSFLEVVKIG